MFIVPLKGDVITVKGIDDSLTVTAYTNVKDGPCVYVSGKQTAYGESIFFKDVDTINGVTVTFDKTTKTFKPLGTIKRKQHLPQPGNTITVDGKDYEVTRISLHNRSVGYSKGLVVFSDQQYFTLNQIESVSGDVSPAFSRNVFMSTYKDYSPNV